MAIIFTASLSFTLWAFLASSCFLFFFSNLFQLGVNLRQARGLQISLHFLSLSIFVPLLVHKIVQTS